MSDRAFLFIVGAGASVNSGIPAGGKLAERWLTELHNRLCHDNQPLSDWATANNLDIDGFEYSRAAEFYPQVFKRRFQDDPHEGYADLEKTMDRAQPSFGYSVLAQILDRTRHKIVVTTNFDNLVSDALAIYAGKHPLVVGHEALAGFVSDRPRRPLVAKIHRDLFLAPVNDPDGTSRLDKDWKAALTRLFARYIPIVIGYGGNDGSLMDLLKAIPPIPGGLFWTYRHGSAEPSDSIREVVARHKGKFVPILGFDELMLQLREIFELPDLTGQIDDQAKAHVQRYREQFEQLRTRIDQPPPQAVDRESDERQAVRQAADTFTEQQHDWWHWILKARAETDPTKCEAIYREGLGHFPDSPELVGSFANFMADIRKDRDEAERLYRRALDLGPNNAINTGNFALFLHEKRKAFDEAEQLYRRALALDSTRAINNGNFANFMTDIRRDYDEAERLYRRALELDPNHVNIIGNFANFMADIRRDYDEAERLFRRALELDPNHVNIIGNFALFMADIRKDHDEAERFYRRALELDPNDANSTGNFALFMTDIRKDHDEAERFYRRALELDPDHVNITGNFAEFKLLRGQYEAADKLAAKAWRLHDRKSNYHSAAFAFIRCLAAHLQGGDVGPALGRIKTLLQFGIADCTWSFDILLEYVDEHLPGEEATFYRALAVAIKDSAKVTDLDNFLRWRDIKPVPIEKLAEDWPQD